MDTLRRIRTDHGSKKDVEEEISWEQMKPCPAEIETFLDRVLTFKEKLYNKWKKSRKNEPVTPRILVDENRSLANDGDELTRELEDAWFLYTRGEDQIPSRDVGHVLRILGQNPTEDEIVNMVMKANCEWEGFMGFSEFVDVGTEILKCSCNQIDDVKAAFRVFDYNNDGSISKEELKDAMVNFGTRCTDDEFEVMFCEADKNRDGKIDFEEFVMMMLPVTMMTPGQQELTTGYRR